jgi:hypothetical protein
MTGGPSVGQTLAASPNITGGIWRGTLGSTLPTDTTTAITTPYVSLGYVGDQGVTRNELRPNTKKFAWGGALVASLQQSYSVQFKFQLLQPLDADVLKAVHSDNNVTVTAATSTVGTLTTTNLNPTLNKNATWVFEGFYQLATVRQALPIARVTEIGAYKWTHLDLAVYDVTMEAFPDTSGNFVYEITDDGVFSS